jgi:type VI secretion system protein ImpF
MAHGLESPVLPDQQDSLMPSLLDRLIDPDSMGTTARTGYTIERFIQSVQRDLEDLLNTRRALVEDADAYPEAGRSIVAYGLPDVTSLNANKEEQWTQVGRQMERMIARFEPRLGQVRAVVVPPRPGASAVQFQIEAKLSVDPSPEVAFVTLLDLNTGRARVRGAEAPA